MEFSVSGFEEPRRAPTLINITRVIPIGIAQDRGFVTLTLLSVESYREGWRAQFRQHVHSDHPVINPYLKAFDS